MRMLHDPEARLHRARPILFGLAMLVLPGLCRAVPIAHWSFDQESYLVTPDEVVVVELSVSVDPASLEPLVFTSIFTSGGGDPGGGVLPLDAAYAVQFTGILLAVPITLLPGESLALTWATLTPLGGAAPPDSYGPAEALLGSVNVPGLDLASDNLFVVEVVPEPAPVLLLGVALLALAALRTRIGRARLESCDRRPQGAHRSGPVPSTR